jgi:hypothetical protein
MKVGDKVTLPAWDGECDGMICFPKMFENKGRSAVVCEIGLYEGRAVRIYIDGLTWDYPLKSFETFDPIVESVINQFKTRSEIGIKKYGTTLERTDVDVLGWLNHLQQELQDATLYIERLKQEYDNK